MAVEYDLVIIGHTSEALFAAKIARVWQARVALVLQVNPNKSWKRDNLYFRILQQNSISLHQVDTIVQELIATEEDSLTNLATIGVDIIADCGEFVRLPNLAFVTPQRKLRSRSYLLATGCDFTILPHPDYLTIFHPSHPEKLSLLGDKLVITGKNHQAIEIAQYLHNLGKQVTLITQHQQLLPEVDAEASSVLQAILEAKGIEIFTNSPISQIKIIDGEKWLQAGNQALTASEVLLIPSTTPSLQGLNLTSVGVDSQDNQLIVNDKLQTTNSHIYACGELINSPSNQEICQYQAKLAVQNALFLPVSRVNSQNIPRVIFTNPPLATVGLTEIASQAIYGSKITVVREYYKNNMKSEIEEQTSGIVKLIVKKNGEIVGGQIVGVVAEEMIGAIATAIQSKTTISQLVYNFPDYSFSQILGQIAWQWEIERIKSNPWLSWAKTWFNWGRKRRA